jgi:hypothetical protein
MSTCPAYAINYFLNIPPNLKNALINNKNIQNTEAPFQPSFADQATFTLINNYINTDSNTTISFQGNIYSLFNDIQICKSTVKMVPSSSTSPILTSQNGRGIYTNSVSPDLILTFVNYSLMNKNKPAVVILVIPLYATNDQTPNMLSDLIQQKTTVSSLMELFNEDSTSYGYNACITTVNSASDLTVRASIPTYILSFPGGFPVPANDLNRIIGSLPDYTFNPANNFPIVTLLSPTDTGTKPALTDPTTFYCRVGDDTTITNSVIRYIKSPSSVVNRASAIFRLNQFKCYPFSGLRNLQDDPSGVQVIPMGKAVNELKQASPDNGASYSTILYIILGIIVAMSIVGVIYVAISYLATPDDIPVADVPMVEAETE